MSEYVSRKSDASSRKPTQVLTPSKWTWLEVEGALSITPKGNSKAGANWAYYLNVETPRLGAASEMIVKFVRNPGSSKADETGRITYTLNKNGTTWISQVWMFQAIDGQPVGVQILVNGKATIKTREFKMAYEVAK